MYQSSERGVSAVYPTTERPAHAPTESKPPSLKGIAYTSATLIVALFLAVSAVNLTLARAYFQPRDDSGLTPRLQDKAERVAGRLTFLHQLIGNLARQPTTQDILEFTDASGAQYLALQIRRFLPQAIGVTLIDNDGRILGEPAGQHIGPLCLADLARLSQGEAIKYPPVHRGDVPALAHFDLTTPVFDDAEIPLGTLLVSFSLDTLHGLLGDITGTGQELTLRDGNGERISGWGTLPPASTPHRLTRQVAGTDWTLQFSEPARPSATPGFLSLVIFNASAFLLVLGTVALLVRKHTFRVDTDFRHLRRHAERLADGQADTAPPALQLREAADILPALTNIQQNLHRQQQELQRQSRTDPLTGLANQRQFNLEFTRAYDFARRNMPVCVVMLQLQGTDKGEPGAAKQSTRLLTKTLLQISRKIDLAARLDDDRFALLLFGMRGEGILPCLERLLHAFAAEQATHSGTPCDASDLRCGYSQIDHHRDNDPAEVLARVEAALRAASKNQPIVPA